MVQVVWMNSLDDMQSENIWFSWYKPSKYREKLICHACDGGGRTDGGGRKVENRAVFCWTRNRNLHLLCCIGCLPMRTLYDRKVYRPHLDKKCNYLKFTCQAHDYDDHNPSSSLSHFTIAIDTKMLWIIQALSS